MTAMLAGVANEVIGIEINREATESAKSSPATTISKT